MIYATMTLAIVLLLSSAYRKIKQGNAIPIIGSALVLCLFAGLRDISFGSDLLNYANRYAHYVPFVGYREIIDNYQQGVMKDAGFYIVMKIFYDAGFSYQGFIAAITGFYIIAVSYLIGKKSPKPVISFAMFIALPWLQFSFTGLRQALAMGLCVIALYLLVNNRKNVMAIGLIVLAGFAHSSAWIFLIAPVVARFNIKIGKTRFLQVTLISVALSLVGGSLFRKLVASIAWNQTLANYANSDISLNWTGFVIQFLIAAISYLFYDNVIDDEPNNSLLYSLMTIGMGFQAFSSVVAEMFRISMYFSIASICVYPTSIMSIRRNDLRRISFYASIILIIIYFFIGNKFAMYVPIIA